MSYPRFWRGVKDALLGWAEETPNARKIARRADFRPMSGVGGVPTPILSIAKVAESGVGTPPPPERFLAKYVSQRERANLNPAARSVVVTGQDGTAWVKGANEYGQFGLGSAGTVADWTPVTGLPPLAKAVYAQNAIFWITEDGDVYASGYNPHGEIGTGTVGHVYTPTLLDIPDAIVDVDGTSMQTYHALTDSRSCKSSSHARTQSAQPRPRRKYSARAL